MTDKVAAQTVTFDTNVYSKVVPSNMARIFRVSSLTNKDRRKSGYHSLLGWYLGICIQRRRIMPAIAEVSLKAEVIPHIQRVALLLSAGKYAVSPEIEERRLETLDRMFRIGFKVLRTPRIAYGAVCSVPKENWALDVLHTQEQRQLRYDRFVQHFKDYALQALVSFGNDLVGIHRLKEPSASWIHGIASEEAQPKKYRSIQEFQGKLRQLLSEWADFDIVATHYAYGYEILCTEDRGRSETSIFSKQKADELFTSFNIQIRSLSDVAKLCWSLHKYPLTTWKV